MPEEKRVPETRFEGFSGEWEMRRLGDFLERVTRKNKNRETSLPLTISAQQGLVAQSSYFNSRVASKDLSNYYLVYRGEFAYNKSTSDGYPYGAAKRLDLYDMGALSTLYLPLSIRDDKALDSGFAAALFESDEWHRGVYDRATEGARNHGLLNISAKDFLDIEVLIPPSLEEQQKIGSFFARLDRLIALQRRKAEKLIALKKGFLQKMFAS